MQVPEGNSGVGPGSGSGPVVEDAAAESPGLLDQLLDLAVISSRESMAGDPVCSSPLADFVAGRMSVQQSLRLWVSEGVPPSDRQEFARWKAAAARELSWHLAGIDRAVNRQLNEVLHHERFQKLESSWRGVAMLVDAAHENGRTDTRLKVLNVSWREIQRDFERATEFDNSELFRKVYEQEFGSPGGTPFGVMIADFEIHPRPTQAHPFDDIAILGQLAGVAAAAFCPFVLGVSPAMFGVDDFRPLEREVNLAAGFQGAEFVKWRSLRKQEDARFIGLAMPRILMREPWELTDTRGFCFREEVAGRSIDRYLWGNAAFAWGKVLIRSFQESGWLADIRGTERNRDGGGLVTGLPSIPFSTDRRGLVSRPSTDLIITDRQETEFARLGFLPLCQCHDSPYAAFYSSQSIQEPLGYDSEVATANAQISTMLQYMLCVSRFSHYLKVIARDVVGAATEPEQMQSRLDVWIKNYVTPDNLAKPDAKARRPLREAEVIVARDPAKPGSFLCKFNLLPHYQLDELSASIRLQTALEYRGR